MKNAYQQAPEITIIILSQMRDESVVLSESLSVIVAGHTGLWLGQTK